MESVWWHGAVTREQLLAGGMPAGTISTWLRRGKLVRVLPGVYAQPPMELLTRVGAALLWYPQAAASHRTAAWLWQLTGEPPIVEMTVPRRCSRRSPQPWLRIYRRDLPADRLERCGHLPTVEPEQTVLDCLAVLTQPAGAQLVDTALSRLVRESQLHDRYVAWASAHTCPNMLPVRLRSPLLRMRYAALVATFSVIIIGRRAG